MADKMTLQERRETLVNSLLASKGWMTDYAKAFVDQYALDAHIAAMGEPAGEVFGPKAVSTMVALANPLPPGTKLYAVLPASGDWDAVQEIISEMRSGLQLPGGNCSTTYVREWAGRLTAALPETQP